MLVTMSDKELSRINVIQSVVEKRMHRRDAAHQLALTERQTQRLMNPRQLRQNVFSDNDRLCVWVSDDISGTVNAYEIELFPVISVDTGEWTVKYDLGLMHKLQQIRQLALPNETGGTILGVTDFKNRTIVLVDVLPEPADSKSSPTSFVRGEEGQQESLERVQRLTGRVVDYVGDWHSHPQGYTAKASSEDEKLIEKLHLKMSVDGLPVVMLIVAKDDINIVVK